MTTPAENMQQAQAFAATHVVECAQDLLTLKVTAELPQGRFRELRDLLEPHQGDAALSVAEGLVVMATLRAVKRLAESDAVLRDIDLQAIAKIFHFRPGTPIAPQVLPAIKRLKDAAEQSFVSGEPIWASALTPYVHRS